MAVDQGSAAKAAADHTPGAYRAGDMLRLTTRALTPMACLEEGAPPCPLQAQCRTLPMRKNLYAPLRCAGLQPSHVI